MQITRCRCRGDPSRTSFHPLSLSHAVPTEPSSPSTTHPLLFLTLNSQYVTLSSSSPHSPSASPPANTTCPTATATCLQQSPSHPFISHLVTPAFPPSFYMDSYHNSLFTILILPPSVYHPKTRFPPYYLILSPQSAMPCSNISSKPVYLLIAT